MQMSGQQRIFAPRQRVWDSLYDPEILKSCIPGCRALTKESDDRLRVIAEIKIGPIGARFNALVTRADVSPLQGCSMTIEGQGGTSGFLKSHARLQLADDPAGGTLLTYEVDSEVGGRLAQLGGPILDATASQLSNRFFSQLGAALGAAPAPASPAKQPARGAKPAVAAAAPQQGAAAPAYVPPATSGLPVAWLLALSLAALVGYLIGHARSGDPGSEWMGLSIGLLVLIVAAAGFEFGRRSAAPVVLLDPAALSRLREGGK